MPPRGTIRAAGPSAPLGGRATALSGDSLRLNGQVLKLAGIESPEREQICQRPKTGAAGVAETQRAAYSSGSCADAAWIVISRAAAMPSRRSPNAVLMERILLRTLVRAGHVFAQSGAFAPYAESLKVWRGPQALACGLVRLNARLNTGPRSGKKPSAVRRKDARSKARYRAGAEFISCRGRQPTTTSKSAPPRVSGGSAARKRHVRPAGRPRRVRKPLQPKCPRSGEPAGQQWRHQYPQSQIPVTSDRRGRSARQAPSRQRCRRIGERRQRTGRPGSATLWPAAQDGGRRRRGCLSDAEASACAPASGRPASWAVSRGRDL